VDTLIQDVRYALRTLARSPAFAAVALATLALGIGANAAIFTVVDAVLLRPLPYADPERLVMVWSTWTASGGLGGSSTPDYRELRDHARGFEGMGAYYDAPFTLSAADPPERLRGAIVTAGLLPLLGVAPRQGRGLLPEEEEFGRHRSVLVSDSLWRGRLGGDPAIVGQTVRLNGEPHTVVGVLPPGFRFLDPAVEVFAPMAFAADDNLDTRNNYFVRIVARLEQATTLAQAEAAVRSVFEAIKERAPEAAGMSATVVPLHEQLVGRVRGALLVLFGAVVSVLLVACANLANLHLARSSARQREIATRVALGAPRRRILRQLLTEAVLLSVAGGAAGLALAWWGLELLLAASPQDLPRRDEVALDPRVVGFTLLVSLLTGIVFGLLPALQASKPNLIESLKEGARSGASARRLHARGALVTVEVAMTLVLLVGAGLMLRSLDRLLAVDPGFETRNVLTVEINPPAARYAEAARWRSLFQEIQQRVGTLPGVERVGLTTSLPLAGETWGKHITFADRPEPTRLEDVPTVQYRLASGGYFAALGIPVVRGRVFDERDVEGRPPVAVINETLAKRFWPEGDPIGKVLWMDRPDALIPPGSLPEDGRAPRRTVVGVVRDVRYAGLGEEVAPLVYAPYCQSTETWRMFLTIRSASDPRALVAGVRREVAAVDRELALASVATLRDLVSGSVARPRFQSLLLGLFGAAALVLAAVGLYGVLSFTVSQRTSEFGVRVALGARGSDILSLVAGEGLRLVFAGLVAGIAGALALGRVLSGLLFGVSARDPLTFAAVSVLLTVVAGFACYLPARRATRVDPIVALRWE
jgi:putative ABC transport system permease protein